MRHFIMLLALVLIGGLLAPSQMLASERSHQHSRQMSRPPMGEQLHNQEQLQVQQLQEQGYFRDRVQTQDQVHAMQLNRMQIREMQHLLNLRGYTISSSDSDSIGRETTAAIRNFQRDEGLAVTGTPNQETLRTLAPSSNQQEFFGLAPEFWVP
ncbi:MAG: peptidoglycan-binding domain-containing protein [Desulfuromonadales bacterium]|nr:peptidoglycan-binding domain-containing protein [Desulfuromonadales bacterium]